MMVIPKDGFSFLGLDNHADFAAVGSQVAVLRVFKVLMEEWKRTKEKNQ